MVKNFVAQIDLKNSNVVLQYGSGTQKKMADFSRYEYLERAMTCIDEAKLKFKLNVNVELVLEMVLAQLK